MAEEQGGLTASQADDFIPAFVETFRWQGAAQVSKKVYQRLRKVHRLVADVVCFRGPHINHLTPRTLDIDEAKAEMQRRCINVKDKIEGPPRRRHPILLRQTSFMALEEPITFADDSEASSVPGVHTARFGEIEQRGIALTHLGRQLYDRLLGEAIAGDPTVAYSERLEKVFAAFPDDLAELRRARLAFFRYRIKASAAGFHQAIGDTSERPLEELITLGLVQAEPITYEDFLPVSAAGTFVPIWVRLRASRLSSST